MYSTGNGLRFYHRIYKHDLATAQVVPQNKAVIGNSGPIEVDGISGSIEILALVNEAITIADSKKITITLEHSDTGLDSSWSILGTLYTLTASSGSGSLAKNTELDRFALKSTVKRYLHAKIMTDDSSATGSLDILPVYLPR